MGAKSSKDIFENKSLGSKVADIIRERIISGEYAQASRITEAEFAQAFNVSHSCVREAFSLLESEGLLRSIRHKCTEVVSFNRQDIEELYSLRLAIEKLCAETCMRKGSIQVDKLREHAHNISNSTMETSEVLMKSVEADMNFHETIIYSSGNTRAINVWNTIRYQLKTLLFTINKKASEKMIIVNTMDHDEIIKAFERSDGERIQSLLTPHIESGLQLCLEYYRDI